MANYLFTRLDRGQRQIDFMLILNNNQRKNQYKIRKGKNSQWVQFDKNTFGQKINQMKNIIIWVLVKQFSCFFLIFINYLFEIMAHNFLIFLLKIMTHNFLKFCIEIMTHNFIKFLIAIMTHNFLKFLIEIMTHNFLKFLIAIMTHNFLTFLIENMIHNFLKFLIQVVTHICIF